MIEITATGGTGIIKYAISPQLDQFFDSSIFENLAPGTYQAIAQDALGCFVLIDFINGLLIDPINWSNLHFRHCWSCAVFWTAGRRTGNKCNMEKQILCT